MTCLYFFSLSLCPFSNNHLVVDKKGIERCDWSGVFSWHKYTARRRRCCCCVSTGEREERNSINNEDVHEHNKEISLHNERCCFRGRIGNAHVKSLLSLWQDERSRERRERKQIRQRQAFYLGKSYLNIEQSNVFFSFSLLFSPLSLSLFSPSSSAYGTRHSETTG